MTSRELLGWNRYFGLQQKRKGGCGVCEGDRVPPKWILNQIIAQFNLRRKYMDWKTQQLIVKEAMQRRLEYIRWLAVKQKRRRLYELEFDPDRVSQVKMAIQEILLSLVNERQSDLPTLPVKRELKQTEEIIPGPPPDEPDRMKRECAIFAPCDESDLKTEKVCTTGYGADLYCNLGYQGTTFASMSNEAPFQWTREEYPSVKKAREARETREAFEKQQAEIIPGPPPPEEPDMTLTKQFIDNAVNPPGPPQSEPVLGPPSSLPTTPIVSVPTEPAPPYDEEEVTQPPEEEETVPGPPTEEEKEIIPGPLKEKEEEIIPPPPTNPNQGGEFNHDTNNVDELVMERVRGNRNEILKFALKKRKELHKKYGVNPDEKERQDRLTDMELKHLEPVMTDRAKNLFRSLQDEFRGNWKVYRLLQADLSISKVLFLLRNLLENPLATEMLFLIQKHRLSYNSTPEQKLRVKHEFQRVMKQYYGMKQLEFVADTVMAKLLKPGVNAGVTTRSQQLQINLTQCALLVQKEKETAAQLDQQLAFLTTALQTCGTEDAACSVEWKETINQMNLNSDQQQQLLDALGVCHEKEARHRERLNSLQTRMTVIKDQFRSGGLGHSLGGADDRDNLENCRKEAKQLQALNAARRQQLQQLQSLVQQCHANRTSCRKSVTKNKAQQVLYPQELERSKALIKGCSERALKADTEAGQLNVTLQQIKQIVDESKLGGKAKKKKKKKKTKLPPLTDWKDYGIYYKVKNSTKEKRRQQLRKAVRIFGGLRVFRHLNQISIYHKNTNPKYWSMIRADRDWVKNQYYDTSSWANKPE